VHFLSHALQYASQKIHCLALIHSLGQIIVRHVHIKEELLAVVRAAVH
jgi:hypothetical protein